jgi:hypothetical protein
VSNIAYADRMTSTTKALKDCGIESVVLHRSLPCKGGTLLTAVTADGIDIAVVPRGDGTWRAEFDDCNETHDFDTVREARVWLSLLNFGASRAQADEIVSKARQSSATKLQSLH